jgi:hypothetical protein
MRLDELPPNERRTLERRRTQPRTLRAAPTPASPSRPDLEVLDRIAALNAASAQREADAR